MLNSEVGMRYQMPLLFALAVPPLSHAQTAEWKQLFDGKDLTG